MCRRCRARIFPNLSEQTEKRIGAAVYWLTSPLWVTVCVAMWLVALPLRVIAAGLAYDKRSSRS